MNVIARKQSTFILSYDHHIIWSSYHQYRQCIENQSISIVNEKYCSVDFTCNSCKKNILCPQFVKIWIKCNFPLHQLDFCSQYFPINKQHIIFVLNFKQGSLKYLRLLNYVSSFIAFLQQRKLVTSLSGNHITRLSHLFISTKRSKISTTTKL